MTLLLKRFYRFLRPTGQPRTVDVLTGYAHWAADYPAEAHNRLMQLEEAAMLSLLPDVAGCFCLDLACGSGRYLRLLRERQAGVVLGLDYSAHMLAQAQRVGRRGCLARTPFWPLPLADGAVELITCGLGVGHEPDLGRTLSEAGRVLRPGGTLLYSDFHPFAALAGRQRTFTARNGTVFILEHYVHLYGDHLAACQAAGLSLNAIVEPAALSHGAKGPAQAPLVLVLRANKE
jgi:malonyl-CoA O-methyltransferase